MCSVMELVMYGMVTPTKDFGEDAGHGSVNWPCSKIWGKMNQEPQVVVRVTKIFL